VPIEPTPIDPVPTPVPTQDDPSNFPARGDAMMEWFETGIPGVDQAAQDTYDNAMEVFAAATEIAAAALVASDAAGFVATSTSSLVVGAGTKTIHFNTAKPSLAVATYQVAIVLASDNSIKMIGNVATVTDSDDITVTVVSSGVSGSGTYSGPWLIIAGAFLGSGATAAEIRAGVTDQVSLSPGPMYSALAEVTVTSAAGSIALDMSTFINAYHDLTENTVLANPTNAKPGQSGRIRVRQHASSAKTCATGTNWYRQGGDLPVDTTLSGYTIYHYDVVASNYILYTMKRNPSNA
jgi:hypothetical protein